MRHVRLIAVSDEYDNELGFMIKGTPSFEGFMADRTGETIPHDILEHQNGLKNMGPVWDELEALGGIWQVRGRHGDLMNNSYHSPIDNLAADVTRMYREWDGFNGPHSMATRPHLYDDDFMEIIAKAKSDIVKEARYEREEFDAARLREYLNLTLHRMRTGFRKAERRFGQNWCGHSTFSAMKEAVAKATRWIDFEGQEFILSYGDCDARIREADMPDYY